ncbi:MAG TPA: response regulator [Longimicrobiaceae bacterium]|nr:response regulator [Longimicrobiaceae bacterium]
MGKILYAEDDEAMREMVTDILATAGHMVRTVANGRAALADVRGDPPDLVLLDYRMGDPDGFEVCRLIKNDPRLEHVPVLMLTAETDMEDRIAGFAAGANDYLPKPFDSRELLARIRALLRLSEQGRELNPTTGLPGGTSIEREFDRRRSLGEPFTLAYLDLDYFKPFNDYFGFPVANGIIESMGERLRKLVAGTDHFAGHIGGDDFVLMSDRPSARPLVESAQQGLRDELKRTVPVEVFEKGTYRGKQRNGMEDDIPLTRMSAALMHIGVTGIPTFTALGSVAANAKGLAKESKADGIVEVDV